MTGTNEGRSAARSLGEALRGYANVATVKGSVMILVGLAVFLLPGISRALIEAAVAVALGMSAFYDIYFATLGRGRRQSGTRWFAALRGIVSLVAALAIAFSPRDWLTGLVGLLGLYLVLRGLVTIVAGLATRERSRRLARLTGGSTATAIGVLATMAPGVLTEGLIALGAVGAIIVGTITLVFGLRAARAQTPLYDPSDATLADILYIWIRDADVGRARREALAETLYFEEPERLGKYTAWWIMLLLSVAIATFAILQDSTAVVIGAMLVAPLMTPILALAGALVSGWRRRAATSSLLIATGVAAAVLMSYALSLWAPVELALDANSQVTSRVSPNLIDMLIALAAGAAGAFAAVNSRASSSMAGVAIAVALVPPLAVAGVSFGAGRADDAGGALLLFLTNFVAIVLAASFVFVLAGFVEGAGLRERGRRLASTIAPFGALALVVLVPLVFNSQGLLVAAKESDAAQETVSEWLGDDPDLLLERVTVSEDVVTVELQGAASPPPVDTLQESLSSVLGREVAVEIRLTPVIVIEMGPSGEPRQRGPVFAE